MKVLLVNPPIDHMVTSTVPDFINSQMHTNPVPPLGLLYIAAYAEKYGHEVEIVDMVALKSGIGSLAVLVEMVKPQIVGITTTTLTLYDALLVARTVKEVDPKIITVFGGAHTYIYPQETLAFPEVDHIVIGEGELPFIRLLKDVCNYKPEVGIVEDIDSLSFPARHLIDNSLYRSTLGKGKMMTGCCTSRGCPFSCSFCHQPHYGKKWRARSAENVVAELVECYKLGIREIEIYDDTFTYDRDRVIKICGLILKWGMDIDWAIRTRVDRVDKEMLQIMARAGCKRINYGIESANPEVLKILRKGITPEQSIKAVKMTKDVGIEVQAYFMIGSPRETKEQIMNTIDFANKLDADYCYYSITSPCPSTLLYTLGMREGKFNDYWREFAVNPVANFKARFWGDLHRDELIGLMEKGYRSFYLRPKFILNQLAKVRSFGDLMNKAKTMVAMR